MSFVQFLQQVTPSSTRTATPSPTSSPTTFTPTATPTGAPAEFGGGPEPSDLRPQLARVNGPDSCVLLTVPDAPHGVFS